MFSRRRTRRSTPSGPRATVIAARLAAIAPGGKAVEVVADRAVGPLRLSLPDWNSVDPLAALLSAAALLAALVFRLGILPLIAGAALAGLLLKGL